MMGCEIKSELPAKYPQGQENPMEIACRGLM